MNKTPNRGFLTIERAFIEIIRVHANQTSGLVAFKQELACKKYSEILLEYLIVRREATTSSEIYSSEALRSLKVVG